MTIQTMDKVHAACTVIVRGSGQEPPVPIPQAQANGSSLKFTQSPAGCTFQRVFDEEGKELPGSYLITLDYPLDTLSCAYSVSPYFDPDIIPAPTDVGIPVSSVLIHIDDRTKALIVLQQEPYSEGLALAPTDAPFHWACWNTQSNRGHMFEMEAVQAPPV